MTTDDLPSVWTKQRRSRDQNALNRAQIVARAVALLDEEGVDALTMRRLGTRLDAAATSLYRHVANRDELVELVVDEVYGEIRVPDAGEWRESVSECARSVREMILRHPWMASMIGQVGLSYLGPNVMRLNEGMLAMLVGAGFPVDEAGPAISAVLSYVIGIGVNEASWLTMLARSGQSERDWQRRLGPAVTRAVADYPHLRAQFADAEDEDPAESRERNFAYGLERVLDGLEPRRRR